MISRLRNFILFLTVGILLSSIMVVSNFILSDEVVLDNDDQLSYLIENVPLPHKMSKEISAVTFTPAGRLVVANRHGEVWIRDLDKSWRMFAYGLHEPLGLHAMFEDSIFVAQRPEVTYLKDTDGSGIADTYETLNEDNLAISDNWHEYTFGLPQDEEGNLVASFGTADEAGPIREVYPRVPLNYDRVLDEYKISLAPWQGWVVKITPSGNLIPWASGFRQPAGVSTSPNGEVFVTDQQGDWIASSNLIHVQKGRFYGHPASLKWDNEYQDEEMTVQKLEKMRTPPAVILPHGSIGGSPGEPIWDITEGAFGPFEGQVFIGDFTKLLSRVYLEKIDGQYQGAVFPFIQGSTGADQVMAYSGRDNLTIPAGEEGRRYFRDVPPRSGTQLGPGNMRMAFAPDGSLYVGQTTRGWLKSDEGLQRIVWTGHMPVEIKTMELISNGFELTFTTSMDQELASRSNSYHLSRFRYLYSSSYGSPRVDVADVPILETRTLENGKRIKLIVEELMPGFIYQLEINKLASKKGRLVENPLAFYTLNRTLDGKQFNGKLSERMFEKKGMKIERKGPDIGSGKRIFGTYCIACHGSDGRGAGNSNGTPDFTANNSPLLTKTNRELLGYISGENEETKKFRTMPVFGNILSDQELEDVFYYLQNEFIPNK